MTNSTTKKSAKKKPLRMARGPKAAPPSAQNVGEQSVETGGNYPTISAGDAKPKTKSALVLGLLTRSQGATLEEMVGATGWLRHTTRAALTGLKKKGFTITSQKVEGVRTYRAMDKAEPEQPKSAQTSGAAQS